MYTEETSSTLTHTVTPAYQCHSASQLTQETLERYFFVWLMQHWVWGGNQNASLQWGGNLMCENVEMSSTFWTQRVFQLWFDMIFWRRMPALSLAQKQIYLLLRRFFKYIFSARTLQPLFRKIYRTHNFFLISLLRFLLINSLNTVFFLNVRMSLVTGWAIKRSLLK